MSEAEAHLRIKQVVDRSIEIDKALNQIRDLTLNKQNKSEHVKKGKRFTAPHEIEIGQNRWKNYCISANRQLYGLKQKVVEVKRHLSHEQQNIYTVRLLAQASLNGCMLLKGLLQFPSFLQDCSESDSSIVARIVGVTSELLQLLRVAGILTPPQIAAEDDATNDASDVSLVSSEVVLALEEEGRVATHVANLAAARLQPQDGRGVAPSIGLPHGRRLHLLHDSLSRRVTATATAATAPAGARRRLSRTDARTAAHKQRQERPRQRSTLKQPSTSKPKTVVTANRLTSKLNNGKKSSKSAQSKKKRRKKGSVVAASEKEDTDGSACANSEDDDGSSNGSDREQLWRQLMPLLAHQDALLHGPDQPDWEAAVDQIDHLLARVNELESRARTSRELVRDCRAAVSKHSSNGSHNNLRDAIEKAKKLLQSTGFLPCRGGRSEFNVNESDSSDDEQEEESCCDRGYSREDSDHKCNCGCCTRCLHRDGASASKSLECLNQVRKQREEFWVGLAQGGYAPL